MTRRCRTAKPADDGLLAARQPPERHAAVFVAPAEVADTAPDRPACVLVAGDHLAPRRGFSELLDAQADLRVIAAVASAEEVLATAERERIDAAVIDHKLGDHDGLWVSGELKRLPRPPRVVLCCQSPHGLLAAAVVAEADALVSTPATGAELCLTIRSTLGGSWRLTAARFVVLREDAELRRIAASGPAPDRPA